MSGFFTRAHLRPDGVPTRIDVSLMSPAEIAIRDAMIAVENAGGGPALTDAITLLAKARDRVADHVENYIYPDPTAAESDAIERRTARASGSQEVWSNE